MQDQWVTVVAAARHLGIPKTKVRRLLRAGKIGGRKIGGNWEVLRSQVTRQMLLPYDEFRAGGGDGREEN